MHYIAQPKFYEHLNYLSVMRIIFILIMIFTISSHGFAQNIGIGTNTPNSSALLDLTDTTRGILIPRMTQAQRLAIQNPADGLMVYQTDNGKGLWSYDGTEWSLFIKLPSGGTNGSVLTYCPQGLVWTSDGTCPGALESLNCSDAEYPIIFVNQLITNSDAVPVVIPYVGLYDGPVKNSFLRSSGVEGLFLIGDFSTTTIIQDSGTFTFYLFGQPSSSGNANFDLNIGGKRCTLSIPVYKAPAITALNCAAVIHQATLYQGVNYTSGEVISRVPYTGGNGGFLEQKTFSSSGVSGLTAVIENTQLAVGDDSLTIRYYGQANQAGIASFSLDINGTTCTLTRPVSPPATISSITCDEAEIPRLDAVPLDAAGVLINIPYTGGDGGTFPYQAISSTGVTGVQLIIGNPATNNGTFANGDGMLEARLKGIPSTGGTAQFALNIGGQSCTLSVPFYEGTLSSIECGEAEIPVLRNDDQISVDFNLPVKGGDGGIFVKRQVPSTGVTGLVATIGIIDGPDITNLPTGDGVLPVYIEGFPSSEGTAEFILNFGGQSCTLQVPIFGPGIISSLDCQNISNVGTLEWGKIVGSDTIFTKIPYTGTKAGYYDTQGFGITSGTVSGITAFLNGGYIKEGNDSLTIYFQGLPNKGAGEVSFELNILEQTCTITRMVNLPPADPLRDHSCGAPFVHNGALTYGTMTDGEGNVYKTIQIGTQEWMAENLRVTKYRNGDNIVRVSSGVSLQQEGNQSTGAYCSPAFDSAYDCPYGKLYNWFAVTSTNNLCPEGWHVPTDSEWGTLENLLGQNQGNCCFGAAGKMKNTGTNYWENDFFGATNASGFSALPAGFVLSGQDFLGLGRFATFWSSSISSLSDDLGYFISLSFEEENISDFRDFKKTNASSVRCVKD